MAATWSESASCRPRINCAPHRCEIAPDRGTDLSAERRTGRDGEEMVDPHLTMIREVTPSAEGCEDCLGIGSTWVHLRLCLTCGHVGCCDSSPHRHARSHFHESGHPIIQSFEPGEDWRWCYVHEAEV
jgi:hypothetical protein